MTSAQIAEAQSAARGFSARPAPPRSRPPVKLAREPEPTRGNLTQRVQSMLGDLGYDPGPVDGIQGPRTKAAVEEFQQKVGAAADGIVGPETRKYLKREYGC